MIKVLQNWHEVGAAVNYFNARALPLHPTPQKNWDHQLLAHLLDHQDRGIQVLDMGSGPAMTLLLLHKMGFRNLMGMDLHIPAAGRLNQAKALWRAHGRTPWTMRKGNICDTHLPSGSMDFISCISVIEHCVPQKPFAEECARLLRPDGVLFITTDYWESASDAASSIPSQKYWELQDRSTINALIRTCAESGLSLIEHDSFPSCSERVLNYESAEYTFLAVAMKRDRCKSIVSER